MVGLILVICWLFNGLKLKILSSGVGFKLSLLRSVELGLVDRFFSNITPSGIGGQPFKIYALTKSGLSSGKASAIVVTEFLLRILFFVFSLPLVLIKLINVKFIVTSNFSTNLLYINTLFFIGLLIIVVYLLLYKPRYLVIAFYWIINRSIFLKLISKKKRYSWKREFTREVRIFYKTIWMYLENGLWNLISALLLTVVLWLFRFSILYFVILGFNLTANIVSLVLIQLIIYIVVIFIPIPGGSGIEVLLASFLQKMFPVSLIGLIVASWRFLTYYTYIIMGGIVTFKILHLKINDDKT